MAEFSQGDAYVDQIQSNILISYRNPLYIAQEFFPMAPVRLMSGILPQMAQSHWFRNFAAPRAVGTRSRRGTFSLDHTMTYVCKWSSYGVELPDIVRDNQVEPYELDDACTEFATDKIQMEQELNFVSSAFTTSVWTGDQTGVTGVPAANQFLQWSDYGNSNPLVDITGYMDTIEGRIGREGNRLGMGKQVWVQLKWHPAIVDNIKYTQRVQVTPDLIAQMFELQKVLVGRGIYTTSPEGTAEGSVTYSRIWGKHALIFYGVDRPTLMAPAAGYTVAWERRISPLGYVKRMRDEQAEIDIFEANAFYTHKVTVPAAGVFLSSAVA